MHGLHHKEQMHMVLHRVGGQDLHSLIPGDAVQVAQQVTPHLTVKAVSPCLLVSCANGAPHAGLGHSPQVTRPTNTVP